MQSFLQACFRVQPVIVMSLRTFSTAVCVCAPETNCHQPPAISGLCPIMPNRNPGRVGEICRNPASVISCREPCIECIPLAHCMGFQGCNRAIFLLDSRVSVVYY